MQIGTEPHARRARSCKAACIRNRYYRRARLGERKFREVARCLALDMSVSDTSRLTGVSIRGLVDVCLGQYFHLQWHDSQRLQGAQEMNDREPFWLFTRRRLQRFMGIPRHTFYLHLKETEYRFNHCHDDLYPGLLTLLRKHPL